MHKIKVSKHLLLFSVTLLICYEPADGSLLRHKHHHSNQNSGSYPGGLLGFLFGQNYQNGNFNASGHGNFGSYLHGFMQHLHQAKSSFFQGHGGHGGGGYGGGGYGGGGGFHGGGGYGGGGGFHGGGGYGGGGYGGGGGHGGGGYGGGGGHGGKGKKGNGGGGHGGYGGHCVGHHCHGGMSHLHKHVMTGLLMHMIKKHQKPEFHYIPEPHVKLQPLIVPVPIHHSPKHIVHQVPKHHHPPPPPPPQIINHKPVIIAPSPPAYHPPPPAYHPPPVFHHHHPAPFFSKFHG